MRRTLIALAAATTLAVPLITLTAVPAASASTYIYGFYNKTTEQYIGSASGGSGDQVPMNTDFIVGFVRINYEVIDGVGFYEYQARTGPEKDLGLCLKVDPGISDSDGNPVVDYPCSTDGGNTQNEEEWGDPPYPTSAYDYLDHRGDILGSAGGVLWDTTKFIDYFELQAE
jgi:hypothetical protein